MVGKILKYYAIARAPKLAYSASHPRKAARLGKAAWDLKHALAPRAVGIAALAVALPVGFMLGRMSTRQRKPAYTPPIQP
jgi:hypothetical protein